MTDKNPFTLTFGKEPAIAIVRHEDLHTILDTFQEENPVCQTMLIEGVRGSGKTVLMTMAANRLRKDDHWVIVDLNPTMNLLENLAARLNDACRKAPDLLKRGFSVSAAGFGIGIEGNPHPVDCISSIDDCLNLLKKKKKKLLITIDEVAPGENMRVFASQFQIFLREDYPIFLIMTGLFENIYAIQNDPALTFLLRSPKIRIQPLSIIQITRQYRDIFGISENEANWMAGITKGYAFAFQALGVVKWNNRKAKEQELLEKLDEMLDDFVYKKIWAALTKREQEIVLAIRNDNTKTAEICKKISMNPASFPKYKNSLIQKGILDTQNHGYNTLSLPRFYEITRLYR